MTSNTHPIQQNPASRRLAKSAPLALTLLVWLFAASLETGYVAVLDSGIRHASQTGAVV
ncbi:MAG TPA: hypothetical protein VN723_04220 [Rhizomicrobium sp.]|jgi:hypothetical protein|nr:hypothetical protein [Rhizomicrobium sp.]